MIELSEIDSRRFGHVVARARIESAADLQAARVFCAERGVRLLIARLPTEELPLVQDLLSEQALLADTLLVLRRELTQTDAGPGATLPEADGVVIRRVSSGDVEQVRDIARTAFRNYPGHYHADPRLDRQACDDLYVDWASRLCTATSEVNMLVAEAEGKVAGFLGLKRTGPAESIVDLCAISPLWRGRDLLRRLVRAQLGHGLSMGAEYVLFPTQVVNIAAQTAVIREGFRPHRSYYTIHRWS